jgi:sucrose phosphorylase
MLSLAGVPGIYVHSLFGSRSYHKGVEETGRYRSINREKFLRGELEQALADPFSLRHQVFYPYLNLIRARTSHSAFHPTGAQRVLLPDETGSASLFAVLRTSMADGGSVLCVHNTSLALQPMRVDLKALDIPGGGEFRDLISGTTYLARGDVLVLDIRPYQVLWVEPLTRPKVRT